MVGKEYLRTYGKALIIVGVSGIMTNLYATYSGTA